jgi:hypothetical protein
VYFYPKGRGHAMAGEKSSTISACPIQFLENSPIHPKIAQPRISRYPRQPLPASRSQNFELEMNSERLSGHFPPLALS